MPNLPPHILNCCRLAGLPLLPLQAAKLCPSDPLVAHELGVLAYRNRQYEAAASWLRRALALVPGGRPTPSECSYLALSVCM